MSDLRIIWDSARGRGDWHMLGPALETGHDLETAVMVSLFTDRVASADYQPTDGTTDRRGWWADTYGPPEDPTPWGSRLWQYARAKKNSATLNGCRDAAAESLKWLIDDGIAASVNVDAQWFAAAGLFLRITITKPTGERSQFSYAWPSLEA